LHFEILGPNSFYPSRFLDQATQILGCISAKIESILEVFEVIENFHRLFPPPICCGFIPGLSLKFDPMAWQKAPLTNFSILLKLNQIYPL